MRAQREALSDALSVVLRGIRLSIVHLPTLLVIYLCGAAGRNATLWASVELSDSHRTLAGFLLPLAPISTLTAMVLMLRTVSAALPWATFNDDQNGVTGVNRHLGLLASTLIPFLTVYAAQGYLKEDLQAFVNAATYDELLGTNIFSDQKVDVDRAFFADGVLMASIVITALVLRFLIGRFDLATRHKSIGVGAAYIEVLWLFLLANQFSRYQSEIRSWINSRAALDWVQDRWSDLLAVIGPLSRPFGAVADALGQVLSNADAVLLVPIAWLTVGAVALGQQIETPKRTTKRLPAFVTTRVPSPVRRIGAEATADLRGRFTGLGNGLRLLIGSGLVPMALFCVVFVIARQAGHLTVEAWRAVAGPLSRDDALAFTPYVSVASDAVYTLLLVGLLAAAVDRVIGRRVQDAAGHEVQSMDNSA